MQSSSKNVTTNKPTHSLFTGLMPFLSPINSVKAFKGKLYIFNVEQKFFHYVTLLAINRAVC